MIGEIFVDNFAGGGGASTGIEMAIGRSVDIAINHDPDAIAMHKTNHPCTKHYCEDVWHVDPKEACAGRPVALAWFSPDCKHFSRAKGGKPVDKNIRGLAWVTLKWAYEVKPRVIMLENVPEIQTWGPLGEDNCPIKEYSGETFRAFIGALGNGIPADHPAIAEMCGALGVTLDSEMAKALIAGLGYNVEFKTLLSCDYGAPTKRQRFYMIARCDGKPIQWPKPTYADRHSKAVREGRLKPYRTAAECIDWSIPTQSIFDRKKPLAENTMKRIARGIAKYVIDNPEPFIVSVNHGGDGFRGQEIGEPLQTVTAKHGYGLVTPTIMTNNTNNTGARVDSPLPTITTGNRNFLVSPVMTAIGQTGFTDDRSYGVDEPLRTIVSKNEQIIVAPYLTPIGYGERQGQLPRVNDIQDPMNTVVTTCKQYVVAPTLIQYHSETAENEVRGQEVKEPIMTVDTSNRYALASAFIAKNYGGGYTGAGSDADKPLHTITGHDHNSLVAAHVMTLRNHMDGQGMDEPLGTVTASGAHHAEVLAFLAKYYGDGDGSNSQGLDEPLHTITTKDRFGLVTIYGEDYIITDIHMRMLQPHELFAAMGFPKNYIIDHDDKGRPYPKSKQVARCGNAVTPPVPEALVRTNLPEYCIIAKATAV